MQSSNDGAVRERKLPIPVGLDGYIVAQDGTDTVEVACLMSRGDPSPVTVPVRDFRHEGRGGFPPRGSWCRSNEGDKAGYGCSCNQEEGDVFHKGSSIQYGYRPRMN